MNPDITWADGVKLSDIEPDKRELVLLFDCRVCGHNVHDHAPDLEPFRCLHEGCSCAEYGSRARAT